MNRRNDSDSDDDDDDDDIHPEDAFLDMVMNQRAAYATLEAVRSRPEDKGMEMPYHPPPPPDDVGVNRELLSLLILELRSMAAGPPPLPHDQHHHHHNNNNNNNRSSSSSSSRSNKNSTAAVMSIDYEKAQNLLEATAGDVTTAAQLYWDDHLATLAARSPAESQRPPPQEEEEEALLPPAPPPLLEQEQQRQHAAAVAKLPLAPDDDRSWDAEMIRWYPQTYALLTNRHRAPPLDDDDPQDNDNDDDIDEAEEEDHLSLDPPAAAQGGRRPRGEEDLPPPRRRNEAVPAPPPPRRRLLSPGRVVAFLDDDDEDDDIMVRRHHHPNRLLQYLRQDNKNHKNDNGVAPVSVKRRKVTPHPNDNGTDASDDDDGYLSDNDWMWESLANNNTPSSSSAWTDHHSPISLPMDLLWGGAHVVNAANDATTPVATAASSDTTNDTNTAKIMETKVTDENGRTKRVVKIKAQHFHEGHGKVVAGRKAKLTKKKLSPSEDGVDHASSYLPSFAHDTMENGPQPMEDEEENPENGDGDANNNVVNNNDDVVAGIPRTWMSAGFHLTKTTTAAGGTNDASVTGARPTNTAGNQPAATPVIGLSLLPPNEQDFAYPMWKNQQSDQDARHASIPLPYHCRSITALLSIVTGLMYTGANVESGGHVSCTSSRQPLQELIVEENTKTQTNSKVKLSKGELMYRELSESDRLGREYETRLVDALTASLRIAAEASVKRKTRALRVLQTSKDPSDQRRWLWMKRKLRLVPTCCWEVPLSEIRVAHTEMPKDDMCCLPIVVSYTNIQDLRSYVQGNIRAFTTAGGCALFMETIARIHGKGALSHMIHRSRKAAGFTGSDVSVPLLCCKCNQSHYKTLDDDPVLTKTLKALSKKGLAYVTLHAGHTCLSLELLSLLLVGRVHSTLVGWSTSPLGLGILSNTMNEMGRGLSRPEKPVWIFRGPTCYSVMWLNGCSDHADTFSRTDHPGTVAALTHWNCWHGVRNATQIRLVTDRSYSSTQMDTLSLVNEEESGNHQKEFAIRISHRRQINQHLARECREIEVVDPALVVSSEEMQRVTVHPDDPTFYPNLYRMWRYDISVGRIDASNDDKGNDDANNDQKPHVPIWKSYHSLNNHERLVIENKLGPKICTVLWTRWPRATVDRFVPNDVPPIV